jgi:hypothetical protein
MDWQAVGRHRDAMIWVREARTGWWVVAVTSPSGLTEKRPVLAPPSEEMVLPAGFESQAAAVEAAKKYLDREHDRRDPRPRAPGDVVEGHPANREAEKRQFARVPVSLPVVGRAPQFREMALRGIARSAGAGGMMVELPVEVVPGSTLRVLLQTRRGPMEMEGKVVWTAAAKGATRHGLTFREPKGLSFIEELVAGEIH